VERVHYGFLVAPEGTRDAGQPIPVVGYVVRHPDGLFLFDTGFAPIDDGTRERYHPQAVNVELALAGMRLQPSDVDVVANCHLHADHGGGNAAFPGVPIYVQRPELEAAREQLRAMLKDAGPAPGGKFADLALLEPVRDYPARHASTMLAFEAVTDAVRRAIAR